MIPEERCIGFDVYKILAGCWIGAWHCTALLNSKLWFCSSSILDVASAKHLSRTATSTVTSAPPALPQDTIRFVSEGGLQEWVYEPKENSTCKYLEFWMVCRWASSTALRTSLTARCLVVESTKHPHQRHPSIFVDYDRKPASYRHTTGQLDMQLNDMTDMLNNVHNPNHER